MQGRAQRRSLRPHQTCRLVPPMVGDSTVKLVVVVVKVIVAMLAIFTMRSTMETMP